MKIKRKFFLKKSFYLPLVLFLIIILLPTLFLGSIYFSPGRSKNFAIGQNTAQINFTPGGINIFYPKDDTTFYYFHNLSWPQQITGTNTKISDPNSTHSESSFTYFKKWLASFFPQPKIQSKTANDTSEKSSSPAPHKTKQIQQPAPQSEQTFSSKLIDLTLTIPSGFSLKVDRKDNSESVYIEKNQESRMSVTIFPVAQGCKDTDYSSGRYDPLRIKIDGKYQVTFTHSSISHGDVGHYYSAQALATKDYCINAGMNIDVKNQKEFTNILEGINQS